MLLQMLRVVRLGPVAVCTSQLQNAQDGMWVWGPLKWEGVGYWGVVKGTEETPLCLYPKP